jgi:hypothetical protein
LEPFFIHIVVIQKGSGLIWYACSNFEKNKNGIDHINNRALKSKAVGKDLKIPYGNFAVRGPPYDDHDDKGCKLYFQYCGDWDPFGEQIDCYIKRRLRELGIQGVNIEANGIFLLVFLHRTPSPDFWSGALTLKKCLSLKSVYTHYDFS